MRKQILVLIRVLVWVPLFVHGQYDTLRTVNLEEVSVNALGISSSVFDFPGAVSRIDSLSLRRADPTQIALEINQIPGVTMQSGTMTTNRIVIRGIGSRAPFGTNKIRAYFGEIPLTDGRGETVLEDMDLLFLGNVEVQKGPNGSLYGSGLGGTILLQPRKQEGVEVNAGMGSFGLKRAGASLGSANMTAAYQHQSWAGYRQNNEMSRNAWMAVSHRPLMNGQISFLGLVVNQKAYIPSSIGDTPYRQNPKLAAQNWYEAAGYEHYTRGLVGFSLQKNLSEKQTLFSSVSFLWKNNYEPRPRPLNILKDDQRGVFWRTRWETDFSFGDIQVGFEAFADRFRWQIIENLYDPTIARQSVAGDVISRNAESRAFLNTFVQSRFFVTPSTTLELGLNRNATIQYFQNISGGQPERVKRYQPVYSPRIGLTQAITPELNVFGAVSHGFSPPSVEESLNEDQSFNQGIRPEKGWSYEVGSKLRKSNFSANVSLYTMHVTDLLLTRRTAEDVTFGVNAGRTNHTGLEADLRVLAWRTGSGQVTVAAAYALNRHRFARFVEDGIDYSGNNLTGVPGHQGSLALDWEQELWFAGLLMQYVGRMPITDDNTVYSDAYLTMNAQAGRTFRLGKDISAVVSYRVNNLFDEKYASMLSINAQAFGGAEPRYYYPGLPRHQQVTVVIRRQPSDSFK